MAITIPTGSGQVLEFPYTFYVDEADATYAGLHLSNYFWEIKNSYDIVMQSSITTTNYVIFPLDSLILGETYNIYCTYVYGTNTEVDGGNQSFVADYKTPVTPSVVFPVENQEMGTQRPAFTFSPYVVDGTVHTDTYISISYGSTEIYAKSIGPVVSHTVTEDLPSNKLLTVKVKYQNSQKWSEWSDSVNFTTIISVPETPIIVTPYNSETIVNNETQIVASDYIGYGSLTSVEWRVSINGADIVPGLAIPEADPYSEFTTTGTTLTYYDTYPFDTLQQVWVIVRYQNSKGWSDWSSVSTFTTWPELPALPTLLSKVEYTPYGSTTKNLSIILNAYSGEGTIEQTEWRLYNANLSQLIQGPNYLTSNLLNWTITGLDSETEYSILVRFKNERGWSFSYLDITHTTEANIPDTPFNRIPISTQVDVDFNGFKLKSSAYSGDDSISGVEWQVSTSSSVWTSLAYTSTNWDYDTVTGYIESDTITTLNSGTSYYWRVRYQNSIGWSLWSSPTQFSTLSYYVPNTPSITSPTADQTSVSRTPTITSSAYSSTGGEPHLSTDWEIIDEDSGNIIFNSYNDAVNLESVSIAAALLSYSWLKVRVRYTNIGGDSDWSPYIRFQTVAAVPNTPTNIIPSDTETSISITPTLVASTYNGDFTHISSDWEISNDGSFAGADIIWSSLSDTTNKTSITVSPALINNTQYWWRVRYTNSIGDSSYSTITSFTTIISIPNTPTLSTPLDLATGESQNPTLTSSAYSGDGTHLSSIWEVALDSNFESIVWTKTSSTDLVSTIVDTNGTFNEILVVDNDKLNSYTEYYWRVRYTNSAGNSAWATEFKLTTLAVVPRTPTNSTPGSGTRQIALQTDLTSSTYDGDATHLSSSWIITDEDGVTVWQSLADAVNLTSINITDGTFVGIYSALTELENDSWYYFKVKYTNSVGDSAYSTPTSFHTLVLVPTTPTIDNPTNDDIQISSFQIIASDYVTGAGEGVHISSDWQLSSDSGFASANIITESINDEDNLTTWTLPTLTNLTYYYVRVRYTNETGQSSWSSTYTFRTIVLPPNQPTNTLPIDGSSEDWEAIITLQSSVFSPVENPLVKPHLASDWEVSTDSEFSNIVWSSLNDTINLLTIDIGASLLSSETTFYWRVRHKNIGGYSNWSTGTTFITLPNYPEKPVITNPLESSENFPRENGTIIGSIYTGEGTHSLSDWEIYGYNYSTLAWELVWKIDVAELGNYLTSVSVNNTIGNFQGVLSGKSQLDYFTEYKFKVKYSNAKGYSDWSDYVTAKSTFNAPNIPICISPIEAATSQGFQPTLVASDYSGNGTHLSSLWQIAEDTLFNSIVWEGVSVGNVLTTIIVNDVNGQFKGTLIGENGLDFNKKYYWRVSYKNEVAYSSYSSYFYFTTKQYEQNIIVTADLEKKLEYLINRFVSKDLESRHPKFKEFIEHWLRFMDKYNNQYIFNMTKFNTIKEFYELVEIFDWSNEIKTAKFENFITDNSLEVLQNIYFGTEINPEILRFFRSLNTRKGSPISFQILMKLLGYSITVSTIAPYQYKVTSVDGKIRTEDDIQNFTNVINLFHPAGMTYTTSSELLTDIISMTPDTFMESDLLHDHSIITGIVLQTVRDAEITSTLVDVFFSSEPTYEDIEIRKLDGRHGWIPLDLQYVPIGWFVTYSLNRFRIQRDASIYNA